MGLHRYPSAHLRGDYARAAVGTVLTGGPLLLGADNPAAMLILSGLTGLFLVFGLRTGLRHGAVFEVSDSGLARRGLRRIAMPDRVVRWADVTALRLRYYTTRRKWGRGWMQLSVRADGTCLRIDSTLDGFDAIAARAARAARARGLALDPATRANLAALGLAVEASSSTPDEGAGR